MSTPEAGFSGNQRDDAALEALVHAAMVNAGLSQGKPTLSRPLIAQQITAQQTSYAEADTQPLPTEPIPVLLATPTVEPENTDRFQFPSLPQITVAPQVLTIGAVVLFCLALTVGLVVVAPPRLVDAFNVFGSPLHILPEWYLLPAFGIVLAAPTKLVGIGALTGLILVLFALPVLPKVEKIIPGSYWILRGLFVLIHVGVASIGLFSLAA
jgi:Cytochrome b(C-terminal)/b6/petD